MAKCVFHEKAVVANDGVCGRCKFCTHQSWWKNEGSELYHCNNCFNTSKDPKGEKWILTQDGKWEEEL